LQRGIAESKDHRFYQIVEYANERAAIRVLDSARSGKQEALTPLGAAAALGEEGTEEDPQGCGIETLIVLLGANNALPSILSLDVKWSDKGYHDLKRKNAFTVWRPSHFEKELTKVVEQVKEIRAKHVI
jgi:hypothetical protein